VLDPAAAALFEGDHYRLRALATDHAGNADPDPPFITVHFADATPPASPVPLTAQVAGAMVTLTWTAPPDDDVVGYRLYRDGDLVQGTSSPKRRTRKNRSRGATATPRAPSTPRATRAR
jgi:hypothetical protein